MSPSKTLFLLFLTSSLTLTLTLDLPQTVLSSTLPSFSRNVNAGNNTEINQLEISTILEKYIVDTISKSGDPCTFKQDLEQFVRMASSGNDLSLPSKINSPIAQALIHGLLHSPSSSSCDWETEKSSSIIGKYSVMNTLGSGGDLQISSHSFQQHVSKFARYSHIFLLTTSLTVMMGAFALT